MSEAPAWFADRSCSTFRDPSLWFSGYAEDIAAAKAICWSCPVRSECLKYQLDWERRVGHSEYGIFGGRTPHERRIIRRHREPVR